MLKNNKGITMIALIITVILLMILASIAISSGLETAQESRYYNAVAEMKTMQTKVNEIYEDYINADEAEQEKIRQYGQTIASSEKNAQAEKAYNSVRQSNPNVAGNIEDYQYYTTSYIKDTLGVDGIDYDFIINIKLRTVILVDGIERKGNIYYAICQIPDEQYNVEYQDDLISAIVDDLGTRSTIYLYGNSEAITEGTITISLQGQDLRNHKCYCR